MTNKPISIALNEFRQKVTEAINTSGIPPYILEMAVNDYLVQLHNLAEKQTAEETAAYNDALEKEEQEGG